MERRVLVTGASGFVGSTLCKTLVQRGYIVRAAVRGEAPVCVADKIVVGDINATTDWREALAGVDFVIHAAARAHVLHDAASNANLYIDTNSEGTLCLANAAAEAGVRRFIYLSSVKVNGEETRERPYTALDEPHPLDAYGISKWFGEQHLMAVSRATGMQAMIVRSPLVYGPGVRANFFRLMRWVDRELPLPLGAVRNRRSLVSIWNLCDLLGHLLDSPAAPGRIWMVSDKEVLSTPELVRRLSTVMGRRLILPPVPVRLLRMMGSMVGHGKEVARLCGSLELDITPTITELGWRPPLSVNEGLARTVRWYLSDGR